MTDRIYKNVKALARINKKELGKIEKEAGLSVGYLSRRKKGLDIEKVANLADQFGLTIDELVNVDYAEKLKKDISKIMLKGAVEASMKALDSKEILIVVNEAMKGE